MSETKDIRALLDAPIPRSAVRTRDESGMTLSYVDGHYVSAKMNEIFGLDWSYSVIDGSVKCVAEEQTNGKWRVSYIAGVRVEVCQKVIHYSREDYGSGHGTSSSKGKAHESAIKEAITDARKRATATFGNSVGLALYDKDQTNISDDSPAEEKPKKARKTKQPEEQAALPFSAEESTRIKTLISTASDLTALEEPRKLLNENKAAPNRAELVELFLAKKTELQQKESA